MPSHMISRRRFNHHFLLRSEASFSFPRISSLSLRQGELWAARSLDVGRLVGEKSECAVASGHTAILHWKHDNITNDNAHMSSSKCGIVGLGNLGQGWAHGNRRKRSDQYCL